MKWERTFEFSGSVDRVWQAFTDLDAPVRLINPGNAYQSGGAVTMEFTEETRNQRLAWTETEGEMKWEMAVTFAETETGSRITIVRSGFGDDDGWLMRATGRLLGWADMLHDLEVYFRTGKMLGRLYNRGWGRSGMQVVEATGGLRVIAVFPGGLAERAGIRSGDMLLRALGAPLVNMSDHWFLESVLPSKADTEFEYLRGAEIRTGSAALEEANA